MFSNIGKWNHNKILESFINESISLSLELLFNYLVNSKLKLLYFSAILVKKPMLYLFIGQISLLIAKIIKKISEKKEESKKFKDASYAEIVKDIFSIDNFIKDFDLTNDEYNEIINKNLPIKYNSIKKNIL